METILGEVLVKQGKQVLVNTTALSEKVLHLLLKT